MKKFFPAAVSILSLAVCLIVPVLWFLGRTDEDTYKTVFLVASVTYFIFAALWARRGDEESAG